MIGVAALAGALASQQASLPPGTLTAAELEATPPEEIARRLFGDLSRIVYPVYPRRQRTLPMGGVRALQFYTRPYGAGLSGICQTDLLIVMFETAPYTLRRDDPPVQPARVALYDNSYFVADLARARAGEIDHQSSCSEIDPRTVPLIVASRPGEVTDAVTNFADLIDGARAGRVSVALDCQGLAGEALDDRSCFALLSRYRPERIDSVSAVPGCGRGATDSWCSRIETSLDRHDTAYDDRADRLEIIFEGSRADIGPPGPARVRVRPARPDPDLEGLIG